MKEHQIKELILKVFWLGMHVHILMNVIQLNITLGLLLNFYILGALLIRVSMVSIRVHVVRFRVQVLVLICRKLCLITLLLLGPIFIIYMLSAINLCIRCILKILEGNIKRGRKGMNKWNMDWSILWDVLMLLGLWLCLILISLGRLLRSISIMIHFSGLLAQMYLYDYHRLSTIRLNQWLPIFICQI